MSALLLRPETGEDFVGFLNRQAEHLRLPAGPFRAQLGMPTQISARWPSLPVAIRAGQQLGIAEESVVDMTLHRYPTQIHGLASDSSMNGPTRSVWMMNTAGRTCQECVNERPDVIFRDWSLGTSFVCLRHQVLLRDHCRRCHPLSGFKSSAPRCTCRRGSLTSSEIRHLRLSPAVLHAQQRLERRLSASIDSPQARDMLVSVRHWLAVLLLTGDATWPAEDDACTRSLRVRLHAAAIERHDASGAYPNREDELYRSALAVAAYAGAALDAASLSRDDQRDLFNECKYRRRKSESRCIPTVMAQRLGVDQTPRPKNHTTDLTTDIRDASHIIAEILHTQGLSIANVPAVLPPPHAADLAGVLGLVLGKRIAILAVSELADMPNTQAAAFLDVPRSIAMGYSPKYGPVFGSVSSHAQVIADLLVSNPRDYEHARRAIPKVPTISRKDLHRYLGSDRSALSLKHLEAKAALELWAWWQATGSFPPRDLPRSGKPAIVADVRRLDRYLVHTGRHEQASALVQETLLGNQHEHTA